MAFKKTFIPDKENHSIEIPEAFYGKTVEIIIVAAEDDGDNRKDLPPGKKISAEELLKHFGENPDFPTAQEIRKKAWPSKW